MGFILSIGVIWVTYQILNSINIETVSKKSRARLTVNNSSDINAA